MTTYLRMRDRSNRCLCCSRNISDKYVVCAKCRDSFGPELMEAVGAYTDARKDLEALTQWATTRARREALERIDAARLLIVRIGQRKRPHIESSRCWCGPTLHYIDPATGNAVYVHHKPT